MTLTAGQEDRLAQLRMRRGLPPPEAWKKAIEAAVQKAFSSPRDPASRWSKYFDHLLNGSPDDDRAGETLGRLGWTVPGWATYPQIHELARLGDKQKLDRAFLKAYARGRERLERTARATLASPHMLKWTPLYMQTLHQYKRRQYLVSVPAFLLIFEGLYAGYGDGPRTKPRVAVRKLINNERGSLRCTWLSLAAFTDRLYANHAARTPRPDMVNRHLIFHGRSAPLWQKADCLRLIQAIDSLCGLFGVLDAHHRDRECRKAPR